MSRIADSIYYTLLSDGCSSEQAAQSAKLFYNPLLSARFDSYPVITSRSERETSYTTSRKTVKGNPGHPGSYSMLGIR